MTLIGIIWALLAPALLLIPVACGYFVLARLGVPQCWPWAAGRERGLRVALSAAATAAVVLAIWIPDRVEFERQCDELGVPTVFERAVADGFFLDDTTANSFGMRYLQEEGFSWIEARSIYKRGGFVRYEKSGSEIRSIEKQSFEARFSVSSVSSQPNRSSSFTRVSVREISSGKLMAQAGSGQFDGGTAKWVLGIYGAASCPNPISETGNQRFRGFYHLARDSLRGEK